ncbi:hypothetical protein COCCU_09655 [Corynebacterium occultum]|uniref:Integrase catalytic domain-containing protein n=1 Tax=Corynebacterium occultum TaxID=2675219 RepID=A0A6B8W9B1_9CORY|nr:hypothetical protein COCCU_09655 [Corynebacterium occultum]
MGGWHNTERIHSKLGNRSPNKFEALYWADHGSTTAYAA